MARVVLDLAAQPVDVDVDRARLAGVVVAPHVFQQLVTGEDLARVTHEERQELEGLGFDRQRFAVAQQPMTGDVRLDAAQVDRGRRRARDRHLGPAEEGPDAGRELTQREWLGHVVVGTELQPHDLVKLRVLGRQHDDRDTGFGADDAGDLHAGQLRQHDVEEHQIGSLSAEPGERLATIRGGDDPIAVDLERVDQGLAQRRFVFHDQDRSCHRCFEHSQPC
jgi:hypothetical protein